MVFQQKLLEKSIFHCQNDWSGYGPTDQFWLLESALKDIFTDLELRRYIFNLSLTTTVLTFYWLLINWLINFIMYFLYYVSFLFSVSLWAIHLFERLLYENLARVKNNRFCLVALGLSHVKIHV